jgi:hypothetical protein
VLRGRPREDDPARFLPVLFTRWRPCRKNDDAHVEQRNWTDVRQHVGCERYDNPEEVPLINALCQGALGRLQNHFLPTHKLEEKQRPEVTAAKKAELKTLHGRLNSFQLG